MTQNDSRTQPAGWLIIKIIETEFAALRPILKMPKCAVPNCGATRHENALDKAAV